MDLRAGSRDFSVDFCVFLWLNPRQRYSATSLVMYRAVEAASAGF